MKLIVTETLVRTYDVPDHFTRYTESAEDWFCNLVEPELVAASSHIETREVKLIDNEGEPVEMKVGYDPCNWDCEDGETPAPAKLYRILPKIGNSQFIVSFHDGEQTHPDGSPFWDIAVCRNKTNQDAFVRGLEAKGYQPE